ncbi:conserved hypothetical protein [Aspergillus udagawae]|uniref:Uncharacterized protein n=1 Tax=Aspergillus udagawae TaxID=91492 RepID=A0A8H3SFD3_9EURO|nr:conserved hypothetical protein [Aspergillus udagawae]
MPSSAEHTFSIYELVEHMILQLNNPVELFAPSVFAVTGEITRDPQLRSISCDERWELNPVFSQIGISISKDTTNPGDQDQGILTLEERIYDNP